MKLRFLRIFISFLIGFINGKEIFFINNHSQINEYIFWDEINNDNALNFVSPLSNISFNNKVINNYFFQYNELKKINSIFRTQLNISNENRNIPRYIIDGNFIINLSDQLVLQNEYEFDSDGYNDSNYIGSLRKTVGKWTGYLQHSSLSWFNPNGYILIGKINLSFSNTNESIALNSFHPPCETIWWHFKNESLILDQGIIFLDNPNNNNFRNLIFHRYAYFNDKYRIAFTEFVLLSYNQISEIDLSYFIPSSSLFETEINQKNNSNLFWLFDGQIKFNKYLLNFELLIDDISIDGLSPNKIATNFYIRIKNPFFLSKIQYTRINRWVGNYFQEELRMKSNGVLLGNQIGPDAHKFTYSIYRNFEGFVFGLNVGLIEKGNGNIDEWPSGVGNSQNFGWSNEIFPSNPKKINNFFEAWIDYYYNEKIQSSLDLSLERGFKPKLIFSLKTVI